MQNKSFLIVRKIISIDYLTMGGSKLTIAIIKIKSINFSQMF